jgi:archaemetzincin
MHDSSRARAGSSTPRFPIQELTLLPIQPIDGPTLERVTEALGARGVRVHLEPPILRPRGSYDPRRRQFRAEVLLERVALCKVRPVLGITDADCYAARLNFVFGIADFGGGMAVACLSRLREGASADKFLGRVVKEIFHETGHAAGLGHCTTRRCVMRFSNSLADTDAKGEDLCAECIRRLHGVRHPGPL